MLSPTSPPGAEGVHAPSFPGADAAKALFSYSAHILQGALGQEDPSEGNLMLSALVCDLSEPIWKQMSPLSLWLPLGDLLSDVDSSAFPAFMEDSSDVGQPKEPQLSLLSPEAEWIPHTCLSSTLNLMSPGGCLLENSLEAVLEIINPSMFDCDLWLPTSIPNFKEACPPGDQMPDLVDCLDCLMDVLVGVQE